MIRLISLSSPPPPGSRKKAYLAQCVVQGLCRDREPTHHQVIGVASLATGTLIIHGGLGTNYTMAFVTTGDSQV